MFITQTTNMAKAYLSNWIKGANQAVNPMLMDDNSFRVMNGGVISYKLGALTKDLGYYRIGDVASAAKSITGLYNFRQSSATQKILRTKNDDTGANLLLQYNNGGTWTNINTGTTYNAFEDAKVEFESFIGYCFPVGYDSTDGAWLPVGSLTNTTFSTSTCVTNMPNAKYIKRYRDRLYVANCYNSGAYPYRVYFSSVPSAGAITWTPATDFIDIDYSEEIIAMGENWDYLLIFTEYMAYYYNQTSFKKLWDVGCSSHRTLKNYSAYMIWANSDGVWVSANMGRPQNIAGNVIDFIRGGTPSNFFAEVIDEEYHLYVGNVTVDGVAYANVDLVFNFATSTWRWRELGTAMSIFARYNSSGVQRLYMGSTVGDVWDKSKYTDSTKYYADNYVSAYSTATDISVNCETKPYYFDDPSIRKRLERVTVFSDRAIGCQLKMRVFDKNTRALKPYVSIGQLTKYINVFDGNDVEFNMVQFEFVESSKNPYFSILGMVVEYEDISIPNISKK